MILALTALAGAMIYWKFGRFPPETEPKGAYLRIVQALQDGRPVEIFPYTETATQHGCYSILGYHRDAYQLITAEFPEERKLSDAPRYEEFAGMKDGSEVFLSIAVRGGYLERLTKDLSAVKQVQINGERATVETVRGTRYSFRRRSNGIWGLTMFSAEIQTEALRSAREFDQLKNIAIELKRGTSNP